jgi:hypothetical protein
MTKSVGRYRALVGLNYGKANKRVEPGEEVTDLPAGSLAWLLEQGAIEPVGGKDDAAR